MNPSLQENLVSALQNGYLFMKQGYYVAARTKFKEVVQEFPENFNVLYGLGLACFRLEKWSDAEDYLTQALKLRPNSLIAQIRRGMTYEKLGQDNLAEEDYKKAFNSDVPILSKCQSEVILLLEFNRNEEALDILNYAVKLRPAADNIWYLRGLTLLQLGYLQQAIASFEKELENRPDYPDAWHKKGLSLKEIGDIQHDEVKYEQAIVCFKKAHEYKLDWQEPLEQIAKLMIKLGNYESALDCFDRILSINPKTLEIRHKRALILKKLEQHENALKEFNSILSLSPNYEPSLYEKGIILLERENYKSAIYCFDHAISTLQDDSLKEKSWYQRGIALTQLGIHGQAEAIGSFHRAWKINPNNSEALSRRDAYLEIVANNNINSINQLSEEYARVGFTDVSNWLRKTAEKKAVVQNAQLRLSQTVDSVVGSLIRAGVAMLGNDKKVLEELQGDSEEIRRKQKELLQNKIFPRIVQNIDKREIYRILNSNLELLSNERWVHLKESLVNLIFIRREPNDFITHTQIVIKFCSLLHELRTEDHSCTVDTCIATYNVLFSTLGVQSKIWSQYDPSFLGEGITPLSKLYTWWKKLTRNAPYVPYLTADFEKEISKLHLYVKTQVYIATIDKHRIVLLMSDVLLELGKAYIDQVQDWRKTPEFIEKAIQCFEVSFEIWSRANFPEKIAETQMSLGNAYVNRINGNESDNLEQAIIYYQKAYKFYTELKFIDHYLASRIKLINSLGAVFRIRIRGRKLDNLERSAQFYEVALSLCDPIKYPIEHADSQTGLGDTYFEFIHHIKVAHDKLLYIDKSLLCYQRALEAYTQEDLRTEQAKLNYKTGSAYLLYCNICRDLASSDITFSFNFKRAISAFESALSVYTFLSFPRDWAKIQKNLSDSYFRLYQLENEEFNLESAIEHLNEALNVFNPDIFPTDYIETKFLLGQVFLESKRYQDSYNAFAESIKVTESLRGNISSFFGTEEDKKKFAEKWIGAYLMIVQTALCMSSTLKTSNSVLQFSESTTSFCSRALEYVERSKGRNLLELLSSKKSYPREHLFPTQDSYENCCVQLDNLRQEIPNIHYELEIKGSQPNQHKGQPIDQASLELERLKIEFAQLQERQEHLLNYINQYDPMFKYTQQVQSITFPEIHSLVRANSAVIEWFFTQEQFFAFILFQNLNTPIIWKYSQQDLVILNDLINQYLTSYSSDNLLWRSELPSFLLRLSRILHIEEIIEHCFPSGITELVLVPHRTLHLLPLHSLPLLDGSLLLDKFSNGVKYAPSLQLLQLTLQSERSLLERFFAVQNPTKDLAFTKTEVMAIRSLFQPLDHVLVESEATKKAVQDRYRLERTHCAHFSCHGSFNFENPLLSALLLAGSRISHPQSTEDDQSTEDLRFLPDRSGGRIDLEKCLTLGALFSLNLRQCRLVTLSACETGLTDFRSLSDEYIGLPSGFLYAGASSVVSSLWTVDDLSTAFLMIKFYENVKRLPYLDTGDVAIALNQAQLWLRDATRTALNQWIKEKDLPLDPTLRLSLFRGLKADDKPFHNPFHWAAFCAVGQ